MAETKRFNIVMAYTYIGDTSIEVPTELLKGKTEEEQLRSAYEYAQNHIDDIPLASNAEYIPYSDNFDLEDMNFS